MSERAPGWMPIWLHCKRCGHPWDDWQPIFVPISTWIAHVRSYRCPQCGAGCNNVLIRTTSLEAAADE